MSPTDAAAIDADTVHINDDDDRDDISDPDTLLPGAATPDLAELKHRAQQRVQNRSQIYTISQDQEAFHGSFSQAVDPPSGADPLVDPDLHAAPAQTTFADIPLFGEASVVPPQA